jgi:hypothetical protein
MRLGGDTMGQLREGPGSFRHAITGLLCHIKTSSDNMSMKEETRIPLAERIAARARALPPEVLDALPDDLAAQHH